MINNERVNTMIDSSITRLSEVNYILNNLASIYAKDGYVETYNMFRQLSDSVGLTICSLSHSKVKESF